MVKAKEVDEDIQYLLAKNEEMVDQINAVELKLDKKESSNDVNVNFSGLAESVADLLMTMSKSSNGSIIINKPQTESVSLLGQFKNLQKNIVKLKISNTNIATQLEHVKSELNQTKNDLSSELNVVAVRKISPINAGLLYCYSYFDFIFRKISMGLPLFQHHVKSILKEVQEQMDHIRFDQA